jgi:uncharacterized LabA/DUF88 family protein
MDARSGQEKRLAVLIDADNTSASVVEPLFGEIAKYGTASVKRIYGDWTSTSLQGWKKVLSTYAIHPIQQFRNTVGKNATDSAMIIDAMDLLYAGRFDGFCLVSSDSDFTRLASRIREAGITVYGFGKRQTPASFVSACDKFIYFEILKRGGEEKSDAESGGKQSARKPQDAGAIRKDAKLTELVCDAIDAVADDDGWADLGRVGETISNQSPSFDSRNYGFGKLSTLIRAMGMFEMSPRQAGSDPNRKNILIRRKTPREG